MGTIRFYFSQKKRIIYFDEFYTREKSEIDSITDKKTNINTNTLSIKDFSNSNFNFNKLIHPIDDEFDKYIKEKIDVLDKIKYNEYEQNKDLLNNIKEFNITNNFNLIINKYKKNESLIK